MPIQSQKKYKVYIWEHIDNIHKNIEIIIDCNIDCFKIKLAEITLTYNDIVALEESNSYPASKYILFARVLGKKKNVFVEAIYYYNNTVTINFVQQLYNKYLAEKQGYDSYESYLEANPSVITSAIKKKYTPKYSKTKYNYYSDGEAFGPEIEQPIKEDQTWLIDSLGSSSYPALSQKVKGLRYASSYIEKVVETSTIRKATVIREEASLEVKYNKNKTRRTIDQVYDAMEGNFNRPCPSIPLHGFVDSRLINSKEEAIEIIEEIRKTGEIPELIVMPRIDCEFSAVICPDRIAFGSSNDGATQGKDSVAIALNLPPESIEKARKNFWSYEEWPFAEVLYNGEVKPILVQLRAGPSMSMESKKVRVVEIYEVDSEMDLIEWGEESKKIRERVREMNDDSISKGFYSNNSSYDSSLDNDNSSIMEDNGENIEKSIAIWHPNGEFLSHFGVHCRTESPILPYITSTTKPEIGEVIEIGMKKEANLDSIKRGLILGLNAEIKPKHYSDAGDLNSFLGALHISSIADLGDRFTGEYLGYLWGIGSRVISALPFGEITHNSSSREAVYKITNQYLKGERDYQPIWDLNLQTILLGLVECERCFLEYKWGSGYGGKAWANCTSSLIGVFTKIKQFIESPSQESLISLTTTINIMINEAHNGGWWLNKIGKIETFNIASILPHFLLSPKRALELKGIKLGDFALKLKGINTIKTLDTLGNIEKIKLEREMEREKEIIEENKKAKLEAEKKAKEEEEKLKKLFSKDYYNEVKEKLSDFSVIGQFKPSPTLIHIQIKGKNINREYGAVVDLVINEDNTTLYKLLLAAYKVAQGKGDMRESLATKGKVDYAPMYIWKGKDYGVIGIGLELDKLNLVDYNSIELYDVLVQLEKGDSDE